MLRIVERVWRKHPDLGLKHVPMGKDNAVSVDSCEVDRFASGLLPEICAGLARTNHLLGDLVWWQSASIAHAPFPVEKGLKRRHELLLSESLYLFVVELPQHRAVLALLRPFSERISYVTGIDLVVLILAQPDLDHFCEVVFLENRLLKTKSQQTKSLVELTIEPGKSDSGIRVAAIGGHLQAL